MGFSIQDGDSVFCHAQWLVNDCACWAQELPSALPAPPHRARLACTSAAAAERRPAHARCAPREASACHQASASSCGCAADRCLDSITVDVSVSRAGKLFAGMQQPFLHATEPGLAESPSRPSCASQNAESRRVPCRSKLNRVANRSKTAVTQWYNGQKVTPCACIRVHMRLWHFHTLFWGMFGPISGTGLLDQFLLIVTSKYGWRWNP